MKNFGILLGLVAMMALSSCDKEYTCTCTTDVDGTTTGTVSTTFEGTKSEAEDACDEGNSSTTFAGVTTTVSCSLD